MSDFLDFVEDIIDLWLYIFFGTLVAVALVAFILTLFFKTTKSLLVLTCIGILSGFVYAWYEGYVYLGVLISVVSAGIFLMALLIRFLKAKFSKA
jgi:hypothetical protein